MKKKKLDTNITQTRYNPETVKAMHDANNRKTHKAKNVDELFELKTILIHNFSG